MHDGTARRILNSIAEDWQEDLAADNVLLGKTTADVLEEIDKKERSGSNWMSDLMSDYISHEGKILKVKLSHMEYVNLKGQSMIEGRTMGSILREALERYLHTSWCERLGVPTADKLRDKFYKEVDTSKGPEDGPWHSTIPKDIEVEWDPVNDPWHNPLSEVLSLDDAFKIASERIEEECRMKAWKCDEF